MVIETGVVSSVVDSGVEMMIGLVIFGFVSWAFAGEISLLLILLQRMLFGVVV